MIPGLLDEQRFPYSGAGGVLALQSSADGADAKAELLRDGGAHPPDGSGGSHGG